MEHGFGLEGENVLAHLTDKFVFVEIVGDVAVGEVFEFLPVGEVVNGDDVGDAARIECFDDVAADKAGRAGYDDAHGGILINKAV